MATAEDNEVSADLAGFTDPEADEVAYWQRVERDVLTLAEPLARMLGHKTICGPLDMSKGQLSRELNPAYDSGLRLLTGLFITRRTQNERLARVIVCDGLGMRMPEWQRKKASAEERLAALERECREAGPAGQALLDAAARRARNGR